jgi:hypothetical protein
MELAPRIPDIYEMGGDPRSEEALTHPGNVFVSPLKGVTRRCII